MEILDSAYKPIWGEVMNELMKVSTLYNETKEHQYIRANFEYKYNEDIPINRNDPPNPRALQALRWIIDRAKIKYIGKETAKWTTAIEKASEDYGKFVLLTLKDCLINKDFLDI